MSILSLWAFSWGKVRFALADTNTEIVAVGAPMSAVPYRSRLWAASGTNDSRLVTWENFVLGRASVADYQLPSTNYQLVSAQVELRTTGDFVTRSNEVETVYRRVDPDDWDDDGWRNEDDPDPCCWEEFYDCFEQELPEGANTNAYCWIEIRPQWNSDIWFCGDAPSDLDDPCIYGRAGETYRVQLLIGKTYEIEGSQPFDVVAKSDERIEVAELGHPISSTVVLRCEVYGGTFGGRLTIALNEAGRRKIARVRGDSLPNGAQILPGMTRVFETEYTPLEPSGTVNDIEATATYVEDFRNESHTATATLTAICLQLEAIYDAPENHSPNRHVYGVGELVNFVVEPNSSEIFLVTERYDTADDSGYGYELFGGSERISVPYADWYRCPISVSNKPPIRVVCEGSEYWPTLTIIELSEIRIERIVGRVVRPSADAFVGRWRWPRNGWRRRASGRGSRGGS